MAVQREALRALLDAAAAIANVQSPRVDLGDVTRLMNPSREEALARMVPAPETDWGWVRPDDDMITAGEYQDLADRAWRESMDAQTGVPDLYRYSDRMYYPMQRLRERFESSNNPFWQNLAEYDSDAEVAAEGLGNLEKAGVPFEYTGKLYRAARDSRFADDTILRREEARQLSKAMESLYDPDSPELTRERRETFLALLPEWDGTIWQLAEAARSL